MFEQSINFNSGTFATQFGADCYANNSLGFSSNIYSFPSTPVMPQGYQMPQIQSSLFMPQSFQTLSLPQVSSTSLFNIPQQQLSTDQLNFSNFTTSSGMLKPLFMLMPSPTFRLNLNNTFMPGGTLASGTSSSASFTGAQSTESQGVSTNYNTGASKIKSGLLKGNLVGKEAYITSLCQKYNVDVALVMTIIGQESGFGTSNLAQHNNFMGYRKAGDLGKNAKGFGYFSTPEKGLEAAIKNLSEYPSRYASVQKADMNNIDAIGKIYCEGTSYASAIKNLYNSTVKNYLA